MVLEKDESVLVITINNERDEDMNNGERTQRPAGDVVIHSRRNEELACASKMVVDPRDV